MILIYIQEFLLSKVTKFYIPAETFLCFDIVLEGKHSSRTFIYVLNASRRLGLSRISSFS